MTPETELDIGMKVTLQHARTGEITSCAVVGVQPDAEAPGYALGGFNQWLTWAEWLQFNHRPIRVQRMYCSSYVGLRWVDVWVPPEETDK